MNRIVPSDPVNVTRLNPENFPFNSTRKIVKSAHLNNYELDLNQIAKLGRF